MRVLLYIILIPCLLTACECKNKEVKAIEKPERVIVIGQSTLEFMLGFGLEDKIAGIAQVDIQNTRYDSLMNELPIITRQWPSKEAILSLRPDLIYSMESAFRGERIGSLKFWHQRGIPTFQINDYTFGKSLSSYRKDLIDSGVIFEKEKEVNDYLNHLDAVIEDIKQKRNLNSTSTTPNILFLACVGPIYYYYPPSLCVLDEIIEDCGGKFLNLGDRSIILSIEALLKVNPDKIILSQYLHSDAENALNKLLQNKMLRHISAIKNQDILTIDYTNAVSGSLELPQVYKSVYSFIHPNQ